MTHGQIEHASPESLAAYVDGTLTDTDALERHIDVCDKCAAIVRAARQIQLLSTLGQIPPLTAEQRAAKREMLKRWSQPRQGLPPKSEPLGPPQDSDATALASVVVPSLLDAMHTIHGLDAFQPGPKPMLAGHDPLPGSQHPSGQDANAPRGTEANSEDSHENTVISEDHPTSTPETPGSLELQQAKSFLERIEDLLEVDGPDHEVSSDEHESGTSGHEEDFSSEHVDLIADTPQSPAIGSETDVDVDGEDSSSVEPSDAGTHETTQSDHADADHHATNDSDHHEG